MSPLTFTTIKKMRLELQDAEAELDALRQSITQFESLVAGRLGKMLDELSTLEAEVENLTEQVHDIREQRMFGEHRMQYAEGAPRPERTARRQYIPNQNVFDDPPVEPAGQPVPIDEKAETRRIYRRLARLYHPDLARGASDRNLRTHQMALINQAYAAGDLATLRRLWQDESLDEVGFKQPQPAQVEKSELERLQQQLAQLRQQIARLRNHPNIQLSLEVKLARQVGRDLLGEMAVELRRKIARKNAERDYLQSQIKHQV